MRDLANAAFNCSIAAFKFKFDDAKLYLRMVFVTTSLSHKARVTKPLRGIRVAPAFQRKEPALTNPSPAFL